MATYAIVLNNVVSNVIVSDNKEDTKRALNVTLVEYTPENPAGIGYTWDGEKFNLPVVEDVTSQEPTNDL